jgi:hypothetical protein
MSEFNAEQRINELCAEAKEIFGKRNMYPDASTDQILREHSKFRHNFPYVCFYAVGNNETDRSEMVYMYKEEGFRKYLDYLHKNNKLENIDSYRCTEDFFTSQCVYVKFLMTAYGVDTNTAKFRLTMRNMRKEMVENYKRLTEIHRVANNPDAIEDMRKEKLISTLVNFSRNNPV